MMATTQEILDRHKHVQAKSKKQAHMSIFGFLLIGSSIVFSLIMNYDMKQKYERKRLQYLEQEKNIQKKDSVLNYQDKVIDSKAKIVNSLMQEINHLTDTTIIVQSTYKVLDGYFTEEGKQLYEFRIWLTSSHNHMDKVVKVYYNAYNTDLKAITESSTRRTNGFLVTIDNFSCFQGLKIKILYEDGKTNKIYHDLSSNYPGIDFLKYRDDDRASSDAIFKK